MTELIRWFDTIDSTSTRLLADKETLPDRSVYAALFQTAGRGQKGNRWESHKGENLLFSLLMKPAALPASEQFILTQIVALGIVDYLDMQGLSATIKWPNDIYVGDRKICGTLIENTLSEGLVTASVAGIGLNMNQIRFDATLKNPTSLALETGRSFRLEEELPVLLDCLLGYYDRLGEHYARNGFDARYLDLLYRRGLWSEFEELPASDIPAEHRSGRRIEARILGIDTTARLLLEHRDGTLHTYGFKEIKYLI